MAPNARARPPPERAKPAEGTLTEPVIKAVGFAATRIRTSPAPRSGVGLNESVRCGSPLLWCELLKDLLPRQLFSLVLQLIVVWLLINEYLIGELKLSLLEESGREDVLIAWQQMIEEVSAAC